MDRGWHGGVSRGAAYRRPIQRLAYDNDADIADFAAAYLVGFARSEGFRDGNKRSGLACALVFLAMNDHALYVPPPELYALTMRVATNASDDVVVAAYLRERMTPRGELARRSVSTRMTSVVSACSSEKPASPVRRYGRRSRFKTMRK